MSDKVMEERRNWAAGGGLMLGLGVGFFLLEKSPLYFTGCILGGIGLGLIAGAVLTKAKKD